MNFDLVDERGACRILGGEASPISRASLWRGISSGRYPKPIKVAQSSNRWLRSELVEVVKQAAAMRDGEAV